jgi:glycosyltransferase involved in cell wall biosynthesis
VRATKVLAQAGAGASLALLAHTIVNLAMVRSPRPDPSVRVRERVSILIPMRNEAHRLRPCVESVLAQVGLDDVEIVVLDDGSHDGTGDLVRTIVADDPRVRVIAGGHDPLPPGWLGKPWACERLGRAATGDVLVFLDADVVLEPGAVAAAVTELRSRSQSLVSPYPAQDAHSWLERLTQPMVSWSWIATLPMPLSDTTHPMWSAAIGQFLVIDAQAYRAAGGHRPVAHFVVEDVEVLRNLKRHGYRGGPVNGGFLARCRMYSSTQEVVAGYEKSLWSVFGSSTRAIAMATAMVGIYVAPPVIAVTTREPSTRRWGMAGYLAGVAGRAAVARMTQERVWPDAFAMPTSAAAFAALTVRSMIRHREGALRWKGREVSVQR